MKETIESVTQWADETFGKASIEALFGRAVNEWRELRDAVIDYKYAASDDSVRIAEHKVMKEAADVCICLYRILGYLNPDAIDVKMSINRQRKWKSNGDGTGQHIKGET